jgi:hypothetical protein
MQGKGTIETETTEGLSGVKIFACLLYYENGEQQAGTGKQRVIGRRVLAIEKPEELSPDDKGEAGSRAQDASNLSLFHFISTSRIRNI